MASDAIRVLLVEDNPGDARLIEKMLAGVRDARFEVARADYLSSALGRLAAEEPVDVVLLDLTLPDSSGLETFARIRARAPETPIVVLSGHEDEAMALRAVQEGAQDYLAKGEATPSLLARSLRYAIERRRADRMQREVEDRERFRKIFEAGVNAIGVHDFPAGRFSEVNREFLRLTGLSEEEALRRTPFELAIWARRRDVEVLFEELWAGAEIHNRELELVGPPRLATVSLITLELGGRRRVVWFFRDVTREREAARALRELTGQLLRAQDEERRRIAREPHDGTASVLVAVTMELASVRKSIKSTDRKTRRALSQSIAQVKECLREIRTVSHLLHPPLLDESGLASALRWYADGFAERSGIRVDLEMPEALGRLPRDIETTLFRVVQEGLTNVHRHSGGRSASIRLAADADGIELEVSDTGRGFPADILRARRAGDTRVGVGISGMRERLASLGGRLELGAARDGGATIRVALPAAVRDP